MNRLIEDYLRTRGVRYFRGHHDDEYFYLVDFLVGAYRGRLNVHLEVSGTDRDTVLVTVTADRYYPAARRVTLDGLVDRWNAAHPPVQAVVHASCDPRLVGVTAGGRSQPADGATLTAFVDAAVAASIELFGAMAGLGGSAQHGILRDAG